MWIKKRKTSTWNIKVYTKCATLDNFLKLIWCYKVLDVIQSLVDVAQGLSKSANN